MATPTTSKTPKISTRISSYFSTPSTSKASSMSLPSSSQQMQSDSQSQPQMVDPCSLVRKLVVARMRQNKSHYANQLYSSLLDSVGPSGDFYHSHEDCACPHLADCVRKRNLTAVSQLVSQIIDDVEQILEPKVVNNTFVTYFSQDTSQEARLAVEQMLRSEDIANFQPQVLVLEEQPASNSSGNELQESQEQQQANGRPLNFICDFANCGHRYPSHRQLTAHVRVHLGMRPFRCAWPDCVYASARRSDTLAHIKGVHFRVKRKRSRGRGGGAAFRPRADQNVTDFLVVDSQPASLNSLM